MKMISHSAPARTPIPGQTLRPTAAAMAQPANTPAPPTDTPQLGITSVPPSPTPSPSDTPLPPAPSPLSSMTMGTSVPTVTPLPSSSTPNYPEALITTGLLHIGKELISVNKRYDFKFQLDGDLVVYDNTAGKSLWSSHTKGSQADHLVMQDDGNLVLYTIDQSPVWSSMTNSTHGDYFLLMQDDGNLVISRGIPYSGNSVPIWATNTGPAPGLVNPEALIATGRLLIGQELISVNNRYNFKFQLDGDLVVYDNIAGKSLWSSHTKGSQANYLVMQSNGNLVLSTTAGFPVWASNTPSTPGQLSLLMQDDGNLVIYRGKLNIVNAVPIWETNTLQ